VSELDRVVNLGAHAMKTVIREMNEQHRLEQYRIFHFATHGVVAGQWVLLSACDTAAGENGSTEAFFGLARAFFYAGARALLVSDWAVKIECDGGAGHDGGRRVEGKREYRLTQRLSPRRRCDGNSEIGQNGGLEAHPSHWALSSLSAKEGRTRNRIQ
jgi:hypothetical protein